MTNKRRDMFGPVADNAIDFLAHSLGELEKAPKYSVIHFCSAIELFLKAKLMLEHWSLIDQEPKSANLSKFLAGIFRSVSIDETIDRLESIANIRISKEAQRSFSEIRTHRNKMVHFFHEDYAEVRDNTIQTVVIEQARAWFYLHKLLTQDWNADFAAYQERIADLHRLVSTKRAYLQAKFDALLPSIQKGHERGVVFSRCNFCKFPAVKNKPLLANLDSGECLICNSHSNTLRETCPACGEEIFIYDLGEAFCESCDETFGLDHFLEKYAPVIHIEKNLFEENRAYCSNCEFTDDTSVVLFHEQWLCLSCLHLHSEVDVCDWCSRRIAGELEASYIYGCRVWCHGYLGNHSDE